MPANSKTRAHSGETRAVPSLTGRGRPRSEKARSSILRAAAHLLREIGIRDMTVDEIARQAGVSKVTIYKWWPDKLALAVDAFLADLTATVQVPDTGSVAEDLRQHVRSALRFYNGPAGRVFRQLIAEGQANSNVAQTFRERFLAARRNAAREIWDHGVARGELRTDVDPNIAIDLIFGAVIYRLLAGHGALNDKFAVAIVETALRGCLTRPTHYP